MIDWAEYLKLFVSLLAITDIPGNVPVFLQQTVSMDNNAFRTVTFYVRFKQQINLNTNNLRIRKFFPEVKNILIDPKDIFYESFDAAGSPAEIL